MLIEHRAAEAASRSGCKIGTVAVRSSDGRHQSGGVSLTRASILATIGTVITAPVAPNASPTRGNTAGIARRLRASREIRYQCGALEGRGHGQAADDERKALPCAQRRHDILRENRGRPGKFFSEKIFVMPSYISRSRLTII